jgi:AsmA protein
MKSLKYALFGLVGLAGVALSAFGPIKIPYSESLTRSYYRYAVGALLVFVLSIGVIVGAFLYTFDANRFKTQIVQFVKEKRQRDLVFEGDIKVTLFPKLGVNLGKVSLSQRNSAKEFAAINNAQLHVAWLPLLRKQFVVEQILIDGLRADLVRYKDGSTNFDDWLAESDGSTLAQLDIDGIRITNSRLDWQDELAWRHVTLRDINAQTGRLADLMPSNISVTFDLISDHPKIDAKVDAKSRLFVNHRAGRYEFAGVEGNMRGKMEAISDLSLAFKGNVEFNRGQGAIIADNLAASATGTYAQDHLETRLDIFRLRLSKDISASRQFMLAATFSRPEQELKATINLPEFELSMRALTARQAIVSIDFQRGEHMLTGKLTSRLDLNLDAGQAELADVAADLAISHPEQPGEKVAIQALGQGRTDFATQDIKLDLTAKVGDSQVSGKFGLKHFAKPVCTFAVTSDRDDLDGYPLAYWIKSFQDDERTSDGSAGKQ